VYLSIFQFLQKKIVSHILPTYLPTYDIYFILYKNKNKITASDLAGETYGMNCLAKGVEDDDSNFTRFLLLGRKGVLEYLNKDVPSKTSVVFTLPNTPGALYKALACFSLRDIDFSKIESRPTSAALLNYLKFRKAANSANVGHQSTTDDNTEGDNNSPFQLDDAVPRFR
jgi:hypothetical protein